jgi:hypothetical protein
MIRIKFSPKARVRFRVRYGQGLRLNLERVLC